MTAVSKRFYGTRQIDPIAAREIDAIVENHGSIIERLSTGRISAYPSFTAAPTGGSWKQGDFVRNSAPAEAGSASSKYVVVGWICTVDGTPGTWLQCRCLTGN